MLILYVVNRARSFSHHAVDMPSLCEYCDLYEHGPFVFQLRLVGVLVCEAVGVLVCSVAELAA